MANDPHAEIRAAVYARLKAAERSVKWLAEQCGIPQTTLNRQLQGKNPISVDALAGMARALRVSPAFLMGASDDGSPTRSAAEEAFYNIVEIVQQVIPPGTIAQADTGRGLLENGDQESNRRGGAGGS